MLATVRSEAAQRHRSDLPTEGAAARWLPSLYPLLVSVQLLLLLLSLWLLHGVLARWLDQPVGQVVVSGALAQVDPSRVQRQLLGYAGSRYMELPLDAIREQLAQDPWIDQVELYRRWPQALQVVIHENRPIARWGQGGLVSERGRVFVPPSVGGFDALPLLSGPDNRAAEMMRQYRNFTQLLRPLGLKVSGLQMEARGAWTLTLDNGIRLLVGRGRTLERMERFIRIYQAQLADYADKIKLIDVRYTNGLTVTWSEPPRRLEAGQ